MSASEQQEMTMATSEQRRAIAETVRRNCTPSSEAYAAGGDRLIYAVADWIENPPEWVQWQRAEPAIATAEQQEAVRRAVWETTPYIDNPIYPNDRRNVERITVAVLAALGMEVSR
jgi:hypothetical protein